MQHIYPKKDVIARSALRYKRDRDLLAQEVGIAFRLCIYNKRNNKKVIARHFFYNIASLSLSFI